MDRIKALAEKEILKFCVECENKFGVVNLIDFWATPSLTSSSHTKKLTAQEWNKLLTFAYTQYLKHKFTIPYRAGLFCGGVEEWISNCKQIKYSDRLSVVKSAFNSEYNLTLTNKDMPGKLRELLNSL